MGKGERFKENSNSILTKKFIISFILFAIFLTLFIISGTKVINYIKDARNNKELYAELSQYTRENEDNTSNKYNIDFASLKQKNSDTVGFIKVNGTDVNHIVVKGTDNNFYLTRNFEKEYNVSGWIFADYRNKLDGSDKNIIIYGHNMRTNDMFGTLKNILSNSWQEDENNRDILFITENEEAIYKVFSVYQIEAEDYYLQTDFQEGEFTKYIDTVKSRSAYNFNVEVDENDNILTLSTCANDSKYRVILHAKKDFNYSKEEKWFLFFVVMELFWRMLILVDKVITKLGRPFLKDFL